MASLIPFSISSAGCIYIGQLLGANKKKYGFSSVLFLTLMGESSLVLIK